MSGEKAARELLRRVLASDASDFYRKKYGANAAVRLVAEGGGEWSDVPFLERAEIQRTSLWDRLYMPRKDMEAIRPTSGTSGSGMMLVPRMSYAGERTSAWHHAFFRDLPIRRLGTFSGAQFLYADAFKQRSNVDTVQLPLGDAALAAALVEKHKIDMLAGFPYALTALMPLLKERDLLTRIRAVQMFGEWCTRLEWEFLRSHLPETPVFLEYASIEAQTPIAESCWAIVHARELHVHPIPEYAHVELADPDTGTIIRDEGGSGEVVVTILRPVGFPLIRYRTGDSATIVQSGCACGIDTPVLRIEGRLSIDRLRFSGGELNVAELDRTLHALRAYLTGPDFEARFDEVMHEKGLRPRLTVFASFDERSMSSERLARALSDTLRVAPGKTYQTGVAHGEFAPLVVVPKRFEPGSQKRVRITRA